jgi:hypothetical protein
MGFREDAKIIMENGNFNNKRNFIYGYNRIKIHNRYETIEHFITKAMLGFLIFSKGKGSFISEAETISGRVVDLIQITNEHKNLVAYEIESDKNTKSYIKGVDEVEIRLADMPETSRQGLKDLAKWIEGYVI